MDLKRTVDETKNSVLLEVHLVADVVIFVVGAGLPVNLFASDARNYNL